MTKPNVHPCQPIDPVYTPLLIQSDRMHRSLPLAKREAIVSYASETAVLAAVSSDAPMSFVEVYERRVSELLLEKLSPLERARVHVSRDQKDVAKEYLEEALREGDLLAHNNLGWIAFGEGDIEAAKSHFDSVDGSLLCRISRTFLSLNTNEPHTAIEIGKEANSLITANERPIHMQAHFGGQLALALGLAYKRTGVLDGAEFYFKQGTKKGNERAAFELGQSLMHPSRPYQDPLRAYQAFMIAAVCEPEAYVSMGVIHLGQEQEEAAQTCFQKARERGVEINEDFLAQVRMSMVHERQMGNQSH